MEGKKYRALGQDCKAVSEVIGQVLMVAVVVLAFSSIAVTVFSDDGAVKPPHVPRTDLQESIDLGDNTVQIFHSGGEAIDLEDIKVILSVNETQTEFNMSEFEVFDPDGKLSSDDVFMLGDYIVIDPSSKVVDITDENASIDLYFVHTESNQVIKKAML
ncbi:MAG TPA: type IV pilin N-terminal domain-containing protein [Chitinispirillaceae bacterium]|nr:type IV pilin N-terminal domain-containing protein [Chitinispirillaceae bacterium]